MSNRKIGIRCSLHNRYAWLKVGAIILFLSVLVFSFGEGGFDVKVLFEAFSVLIAVFALSYTARTIESTLYINMFSTMNMNLMQRINSSSLMFPQFVTKQISLFAWGIKQEEMVESKEQLFICDSSLSVYDNFYHYFEAHRDVARFSQLDHRQILCIWESFCKNLKCRDDYDAVFKLIFHCVKTVVDSPVREDIKERHVKAIQGSISAKVLFCYFVNQIHYHGRNKLPDNYWNTLKKYGFFKDFFKSAEYKEVERLIPMEIELQLR